MTASLIYKIAETDAWDRAVAAGRYDGSADDARDGFIHFSTAAQLRATADRHFAGRAALTLIEYEAAALAASLKWEPSRGGALFPHVYGSLDPKAARRVWPLALGGGAHLFPPEIGA